MQPPRIFAPVRPPVAQRRLVVGAAVEPAVVEHEALHAQRRAGAGERLQVGHVMLEIHGLPGVQVDRPRRHRAVRPAAQVAPHIAVEIVRHPVQAVRTEAEASLGRPVRLARRQHDLARRQPFAQLQLAAAVRSRLDQQRMVAAPAEVGAPHRPVALAQVDAGDHAREAVVRGAAAAVVAPPGAHAQALPRLLEFQRVAAGEGDDLVRFGRQRHGGGGQPVEPEGAVAQVAQFGFQRHHVGVGVQRVAQRRRQLRHLVAQAQGQLLALLLPAVQAHFLRPVEVAAAVLRPGPEQARLAEPAKAERRQDRQRQVVVARRRRQRAAVALAPARPGVGVGQARAEMAPQRRRVQAQFNEECRLRPVEAGDGGLGHERLWCGGGNGKKMGRLRPGAGRRRCAAPAPGPGCRTDGRPTPAPGS